MAAGGEDCEPVDAWDGVCVFECAAEPVGAGRSARDAAVMAKRYVAEAIRTAEPMGKGMGPVNHLWPLRDE